MVADIFQTKLLDGRPAKFLRTYGRYKFIVDVDGVELAILRETWRSLPFLADAGGEIADSEVQTAITDGDAIERRGT